MLQSELFEEVGYLLVVGMDCLNKEGVEGMEGRVGVASLLSDYLVSESIGRVGHNVGVELGVEGRQSVMQGLLLGVGGESIRVENGG